jgi:hypothetical protein
MAELAERQIDLVVDHKDALEWQPVGATRRSDRATGVVHVGERLEQRHARSALAGAAFA